MKSRMMKRMKLLMLH